MSEKILTELRVNMMAPCEMVMARVSIAAPQNIRFHLGDATCDGCIAKMIAEKIDDLHIRIKVHQPRFNGRCIRKRGHDEVILG